MSRPLTAAAIAVTLLLTGCAGSLPVDPATIGTHPANPDAPTAASPPRSQTLAITDPPAAESPPPDGMQKMSDMAPAATPPATQPTTQVSAQYTCPMHASVHADAPGRCPICGMRLVKNEGGER